MSFSDAWLYERVVPDFAGWLICLILWCRAADLLENQSHLVLCTSNGAVRYPLFRALGSSSQSCVYASEDPLYGRCAVKATVGDCSQLLNEIDTLQRLKGVEGVRCERLRKLGAA